MKLKTKRAIKTLQKVWPYTHVKKHPIAKDAPKGSILAKFDKDSDGIGAIVFSRSKEYIEEVKKIDNPNKFSH